MKYLILVVLVTSCIGVVAQTRVYPVIENYGGVFPIPYAAEKPDPNLVYNIVIEIERPSDMPDTLNWALNNVARLLNLHVSGGVPKEKIHVVLAIHGGAAYTVMNNESHRAKYGVDNPNRKLYQELSAAGVKILVCGQSLVARNIDPNKMVSEVKIATSMLTVLTTFQLKGFAMLKF